VYDASKFQKDAAKIIIAAGSVLPVVEFKGNKRIYQIPGDHVKLRAGE
jgi:hypothetical protein